MMHSPMWNMAIVARQKLSGAGDHWGVVRPDGSVFDITHSEGVRIVSFHEFAAGKIPRVVEIIPREKAAAANSRIYDEMINAKPYHFIDNNCEIVANRVAGNPAISPQVTFWAVALLLGCVVWIAKR